MLIAEKLQNSERFQLNFLSDNFVSAYRLATYFTHNVLALL